MFYNLRERYAEAETLFLRAFAILPQNEDFDLLPAANGMINLAMIYHEQGKRAEAEPWQRRGLEILSAAFGPEHPYVVGIIETMEKRYGP